MSWNNVRLQPRVSKSFFTTPVGAPSNLSSSLHTPNLPATKGPNQEDRINTNGVIEDPEFTLWGRWHKGGLNTLTVDGNTVSKVSGYGWRAAIGKHPVERGIRRVELEVVSKTGLMQVGVIGEVYQVLIFVYSDTLRSISASDKAYQDVWNDENAVDVWYMMSNGDLYSGGTRLFKTGKQIRTGDVIGLEIDMTYGRTVVRKVAATSKGDHVFGGPCKACAGPPEGLEECRVWNARQGSDGYVGQLSDIMTFPARIIVGNLPRGKQQAGTGIWLHPCGTPMAEVLSEFLNLFAPVQRVVFIQRSHRTATVEFRDCYAVQPNGEYEIDAIRCILQALSGIEDVHVLREMDTPHGQRIALLQWRGIWALAGASGSPAPCDSPASASSTRFDKFLGPDGLLVEQRRRPALFRSHSFPAKLSSRAASPTTHAAHALQRSNSFRPATLQRSRSFTPQSPDKRVPYRGRHRSSLTATSPAARASPLGAVVPWARGSASLFPAPATSSSSSRREAASSPPTRPSSPYFPRPGSPFAQDSLPRRFPFPSGSPSSPSARSPVGSPFALRRNTSDESTMSGFTFVSSEGSEAGAEVEGVFIAPVTGRGKVYPSVAMAKKGSAVRLREVKDELEDARIGRARAAQLRHFGEAPSPWGRAEPGLVVQEGGKVLRLNRAGVGGRGAMFSTALSLTWMARVYSHAATAIVRMQGSHVPKDGWLPHNDGRWGQRKWEVNDEVLLNKRRFNFEILQAGIHGDVYSSGLSIGVLAINPRKPLQLDRGWRSALFDGHAYYVDGSKGEDRNGIPTGGCLYDGDKVIFKQQVTKLHGFVQGDVVGVEIDMGRQLKDEDGNMLPETVMGAFQPTTVRFFHNKRLVPGKLTEPICLVGHTGREGAGPLAVHPAVCLQGEGDCVRLTEVHWSVWPCPHDSHAACTDCVERKAELAAEAEEEKEGKEKEKAKKEKDKEEKKEEREEVKFDGPAREEVKKDGEEREEIQMEGEQRGEVEGSPRRGQVRQEGKREEMQELDRGELEEEERRKKEEAERRKEEEGNGGEKRPAEGREEEEVRTEGGERGRADGVEMDGAERGVVEREGGGGGEAEGEGEREELTDSLQRGAIRGGEERGVSVGERSRSGHVGACAPT